MEYFKKLEGEKIYLSPMNKEDAEIYTKWLNDFNVTDYIGRSGGLMTLEKEIEWLEKNSKDNSYILSIVKKENNEMIGNCSIFDINSINRTATIGIMIGESENRNKGYGTEALKLLVSFAFYYLNLNNVMLEVLEFNERAIATYKKVGFKEFGRRNQSEYVNGKYYDRIYMEILKKDFSTNYIQNANQ